MIFNLILLSLSCFITLPVKLFFELTTPCYLDSPEGQVLQEIYLKLVKEELNEYAYQGEIAGLDYTLNYGAKAMTVLIIGYSEKVGVLAEKIFDILKKWYYAKFVLVSTT